MASPLSASVISENPWPHLPAGSPSAASMVSERSSSLQPLNGCMRHFPVLQLEVPQSNKGAGSGGGLLERDVGEEEPFSLPSAEAACVPRNKDAQGEAQLEPEPEEHQEQDGGDADFCRMLQAALAEAKADAATAPPTAANIVHGQQSPLHLPNAVADTATPLGATGAAPTELAQLSLASTLPAGGEHGPVQLQLETPSGAPLQGRLGNEICAASPLRLSPQQSPASSDATTQERQQQGPPSAKVRPTLRHRDFTQVMADRRRHEETQRQVVAVVRAA